MLIIFKYSTYCYNILLLEESLFSAWPKCDPDYLEGYYTIAHTDYCDRYFTCQNSIAYLMQCQDGFGYTPFLGCRLLHRVDCKGRSKLRKYIEHDIGTNLHSVLLFNKNRLLFFVFVLLCIHIIIRVLGKCYTLGLYSVVLF